MATSYHDRLLAARLKDPESGLSMKRASAEIAQIDAVLRTLDHLREEAGMSKAEIARQIGKNPAAFAGCSQPRSIQSSRRSPLSHMP